MTHIRRKTAQLVRLLVLSAGLYGSLYAHAQTTHVPAPHAVSQGGVRFAFIGDTPYSEREERYARAVIEDIGAPNTARSVDFVIHIGDLKGGGELCSDELLESRAAVLRSSIVPLIYVPGDNEWTDCHRKSNGSFNPIERLERLRQMFFATPDSLGARSIKLTRQSEGSRYKDYVEHQRWSAGSAVFVSLNVPGSNNNYQLGAGRNGEWEDRNKANADWLQRAVVFAKQSKAKVLVIAAHADPIFSRTAAAAATVVNAQPDGYKRYKEMLRNAAQQFDGKVILLHGDTHVFKHDQPLLDDKGKVIKNFTRIECFGSPFYSQWVLININEHGDVDVTTRRFDQDATKGLK